MSGMIMICFAIPMVWMNERKQVKIYQLIENGREKCEKADSASPNPDHHKKLVCTTGELATEDKVKDDLFDIQVDDAVKL
jgi:hypothetical protein